MSSSVPKKPVKSGKKKRVEPEEKTYTEQEIAQQSLDCIIDMICSSGPLSCAADFQEGRDRPSRCDELMDLFKARDFFRTTIDELQEERAGCDVSKMMQSCCAVEEPEEEENKSCIACEKNTETETVSETTAVSNDGE